MENFKEKLKKLNGEQVPRETIINIMLYMTVLIMPFILIPITFNRYALGKLMFLYVVGIFLTINLIRNGKFKIRKEHIIVTIFILTIFIVCVLSPYKKIAFIGNGMRDEGFFTILIYVILFVASSVYLKITKKSVDIILLFGSIHAVYGILEFFHFDPIQKLILEGIVADDSIGFIGNKMNFSAYIILFLTISTCMYIFEGKKRYFISTIILFTCLLCTLTRSGWLAFGVTLIIGLLFILKRKECLKRALILTICFILALVILNTASSGRVIGRINTTVGEVNGLKEEKEDIQEDTKNDEEDTQNDEKSNVIVNESLYSRKEILKLHWKAFLDKPLLGTGPDTFNNRLMDDYPAEFVLKLLTTGEGADKAHNEYLEYASSCGIFTAASYIILLIFIIKGLLKRRKENDKYEIILLTVIAYMIQAFFNISVTAVSPLFWILLGYAVQIIYEKNILKVQ